MILYDRQGNPHEVPDDQADEAVRTGAYGVDPDTQYSVLAPHTPGSTEENRVPVPGSDLPRYLAAGYNLDVGSRRVAEDTRRAEDARRREYGGLEHLPGAMLTGASRGVAAGLSLGADLTLPGSIVRAGEAVNESLGGAPSPLPSTTEVAQGLDPTRASQGLQSAAEFHPGGEMVGEVLPYVAQMAASRGGVVGRALGQALPGTAMETVGGTTEALVGRLVSQYAPRLSPVAARRLAGGARLAAEGAYVGAVGDVTAAAQEDRQVTVDSMAGSMILNAGLGGGLYTIGAGASSLLGRGARGLGALRAPARRAEDFIVRDSESGLSRFRPEAATEGGPRTIVECLQRGSAELGGALQGAASPEARLRIAQQASRHVQELGSMTQPEINSALRNVSRIAGEINTVGDEMSLPIRGMRRHALLESQTNALDSTLLREQAARRLVDLTPEVRAGFLDEIAVPGHRQALKETLAAIGRMRGELVGSVEERASTILSGSRGQEGQALTRTITTPPTLNSNAEIVQRFDELRRWLDFTAGNTDLQKPMSTQMKDILQKTADNVRSFLRDPNVLGEELAMQNGRIIDAQSAIADVKSRFESAFGVDPNYPNQPRADRMEAWGNRLTTTGADVPVETLRDYMVAYRNLAKVTGEMTPEQMGLVKRMERMLKDFEAAHDSVFPAMEARSFRLSGLRTEGSMSGGGLSSGSSGINAMAVGGYLGGVPGFGLGVAFTAISRPVRFWNQIGSLSNLMRTISEKFTSKMTNLSQVLTGAKSASRMALPPVMQFLSRASYKEKVDLYDEVTSQVSELAARPDIAVAAIGTANATMAQLDPGMADLLSQASMRGIQILAQSIQPRGMDPLTGRPYPPSLTQINDFFTRAGVIQDPMSVIDLLAAGRATTVHVSTLQMAAPALHSRIANETMRIVAQAKKPLPYSMRVQLGTLLGRPTDPTMVPQFVMTMMQARQTAQTPARGGSGRGSNNSFFSASTMTTAQSMEQPNGSNQ